ncbi:MAG: methylated-DNA--[protein]-cysteine S-methyltransferase [Candidatus Azobacteroides sp.]|nr:methylated-DNA--[protein]-cysteine S-methyltransferase [Candidatus Azobacteroides sp.]
MYSCYITNFPAIGSVKIASDGNHITGLSVLPSYVPDTSSPDIPEIIKDCIEELKEYFQGKRKIFTVPFSQVGTEFQEAVWKALEKIPYGETISYAELAKRINNPKAIRAVGSANGRNNLCILVPCHRVINTGGRLGGYAYGLEMKRFLLDLEKQHK